MSRTSASVWGLRLEVELALRATVGRLIEHKTWIVLLVGVGVSSVMALVEREQGSFGAADRVLSGTTFGAVLPLFAYLASESAIARRRLSTELLPIVRHGGSSVFAALGVLIALTSTLALGGALLGASAATVARGLSDESWIRDSLASAWVGGLGGAVYATCFLFASTFGKRGGGRVVFLGLDCALGLTSGPLALPWPRSHLRSLVGGEPPLGWSQSSSLLALLLILLLTAGFALRRTRL